MPHEPPLTPSQLADLAALADGTVDPGRREALQEWISSSPALEEAYREQRRAVTLVHQARSERAPDRLRARIEGQRNRSRAPAPRRLRFGLVLAVPVAAAVAILALALPTGTPGAPSVSEAAALARRGPQHAAPAPDPRRRSRLSQTVEAVYFPNWGPRLGWHAVGQRVDRLGGRTAVTVYYAKGGRRVAYTILAAPALPQPGATIRQVRGVALRTLLSGGRTIVTWRRAGQTCVISATGVPRHVLQHLAIWD